MSASCHVVVIVLCLFLTVPLSYLHCVIVIFSGHKYLTFLSLTRGQNTLHKTLVAVLFKVIFTRGIWNVRSQAS